MACFVSNYQQNWSDFEEIMASKVGVPSLKSQISENLSMLKVKRRTWKELSLDLSCSKNIIKNNGLYKQCTYNLCFNLFQAIQQDTEPYMLIFGGKEKQETNFGIKPLSVWKCKLKKL